MKKLIGKKGSRRLDDSKPVDTSPTAATSGIDVSHAPVESTEGHEEELAILKRTLTAEVENIEHSEGSHTATEGPKHPVPLTDDQVPGRYIRGCLGDMEEAKRRWLITKEWREENCIDQILEQPQPHFAFIKKNYSHSIHKVTKDGYYVWIEQPGKSNLDAIWKQEIDLDALRSHYIFVTEFLWRMVDPREDGMILSIFDLKGSSISELAGNTVRLFKKCSEVMQAHYPERSAKIVIINSPWWFQTAFNIVSPFLDPRTTKKIVVHGKDYEKHLLQLIDSKNLPQALGGSDTDEIGDSPVERMMWEHVKQVNEKHKVPMVSDFKTEKSSKDKKSSSSKEREKS